MSYDNPHAAAAAHDPEVARARGNEASALEWEARSREVRPPIELDPEVLKAFEAAMGAAEEEENS